MWLPSGDAATDERPHPRPAGPLVSGRARPRWRQPRVVVAWLMFVACACSVLYLGSPEFSAAHTRGIIGPLLLWLFPDMSAADRWQLHNSLRELAHPVEYAVLALLAFRAVFVSLETLLARLIALSLLLVLAVAATDEVRQSFTPTRTGTIWDVGSDLLGAGIALGLVALVLRRRSRASASSAEAS